MRKRLTAFATLALSFDNQPYSTHLTLIPHPPPICSTFNPHADVRERKPIQWCHMRPFPDVESYTGVKLYNILLSQ